MNVMFISVYEYMGNILFTRESKNIKIKCPYTQLLFFIFSAVYVLFNIVF